MAAIRSIVGQSVTKNDQPWTVFVRGSLAADPEWAKHVERLSPRISLRKATEDYVHALSSRAAVTPEDAKTVELILKAMKRHRFASLDSFFAAVDRGELSLTDGVVAKNGSKPARGKAAGKGQG